MDDVVAGHLADADRYERELRQLERRSPQRQREVTMPEPRDTATMDGATQAWVKAQIGDALGGFADVLGSEAGLMENRLRAEIDKRVREYVGSELHAFSVKLGMQAGLVDAQFYGKLKNEVGKGFEIRGTYDPAATYKKLDIVTLNASWFVARVDDPGPCPGPNWQSGPSGRRGKDADTKEIVRLRDEVRLLRADVMTLRAAIGQGRGTNAA
jgi:hypothetical protein